MLSINSPCLRWRSGWCNNQPAPAVIGRQHTVVTSEVRSRFWYESHDKGDEIHRLECHLCRPIALGRAASLVRDGQWVAVFAITHFELAFEIGTPH